MSAFVYLFYAEVTQVLSRSYKDSCQGFKFSLKILVVCQGVKDSSQRNSKFLSRGIIIVEVTRFLIKS